MRIKYLEFYNSSFGSGKHCTKSWGLTSFEAGAASQLAEIDELQNRIDEAEKWIELNRKTIALEYSGYTTEEYVDADEVVNILKGGGCE